MKIQPAPAPWHAEKSMWLVVALPVIAVLACAVSLWLAFTRADREMTEVPVPHALGSNSVTPPER